jgi:hypothetical protein
LTIVAAKFGCELHVEVGLHWVEEKRSTIWRTFQDLVKNIPTF